MGGLLLTGRGTRLIVGYDTMPKKERERYDKRALCRFMGKLMFFCTACLLVMGAAEAEPGRVLLLAGPLWLEMGTSGAVIWANTGDRFRKMEESRKEPESETSRREVGENSSR